MQVIFDDKDLEQLIMVGNNHKYRKYSKDARFMQALARMYKIMTAVADAKALSTFSYLHYERLKGIDISSVRVMNNRVERVLFKETENGIVITIIDLDNTHYGNKK